MPRAPGKKIFISWSRQASHEIATQLRTIIAESLDLECFLSSRDIAAGVAWLDAVTRELRKCRSALLVITPDNLRSEWMLWEAGAVYNKLRNQRTIPVLINVRQEDLPEPLRHFQCCELMPRSPRAGGRTVEEALKTLLRQLRDHHGGPAGGDFLQRFNALYPGVRSSFDAALDSIQTGEDAFSAIIERQAWQIIMQMASVISPIYVMNQHFDIVHFNHAADAVFGLSRLAVTYDGRIPGEAFFQHVRETLSIENIDAHFQHFIDQFANSTRVPTFDIEDIALRHEDYGRIVLKKIAFPVMETGCVAATRGMGLGLGHSAVVDKDAVSAWVVTYNVLDARGNQALIAHVEHTVRSLGHMNYYLHRFGMRHGRQNGGVGHAAS